MPQMKLCSILTLLIALSTFTGCEGLGYLAYTITGSEKQDIKAEYKGLEGQRVAVLVDADAATLTRYPRAQLEICEAISLKLAANVKDISVVAPRAVIDYQNRNSYWTTATYQRLAKELNVSRVILVELAEFTMHEPGNRYVLRGTITANVAVADAKETSPNRLAYDTTIKVIYPEGDKIGVVNREEKNIRFATVDLFSQAATSKFYDHTIEKDY